MTHIEVLEAIAQMYQDTRYLEIGIGDSGCFQRVVGYCRDGIAVDVPSNPYGDVGERVDALPNASYHGEGSDAFFRTWHRGAGFNLIFIDGSHWEEQVWRDWRNSLRVLAPLGTIALHDTWAATREEAEQGSDTAYRVAEVIEADPAFDCFTLPIRPGLTLARPRVPRFS